MRERFLEILKMFSQILRPSCEIQRRKVGM
jgi:hypothetical protein